MDDNMSNMTSDGYARIYVGGLNESIKKEDLQSQFEKFGKLNKVWVAFNPPGFAFIEYFNMDEAEMACSNMNGTEIMGAKLRVEISRGRGRGGKGGFKGRGGRGGGGFRGGYRGAGGYEGGGGGSYGYSGGRGGGNGGGRYGGGGGAGQGGYGRPAGGYQREGGYSQDSYGSGGGAGAGGNDYYSGRNTSSSRYRSRSPAGRGSQRHLRECT